MNKIKEKNLESLIRICVKEVLETLPSINKTYNPSLTTKKRHATAILESKLKTAIKSIVREIIKDEK